MRKRQKSEKAPLTDFQSDLQIVHLTTALEAEKQTGGNSGLLDASCVLANN